MCVSVCESLRSLFVALQIASSFLTSGVKLIIAVCSSSNNLREITTIQFISCKSYL
jgi:hypothetical protein